MTVPTITAMPPVPGSEVAFTAAAAEAFIAAIPTAITESNTQAAYRAIHDPPVEIDGLSASGEAAGPAEWVSGTTYARGVVVWSPADGQDYIRLIAGAGTTDPSADPTNWQLVTGAGDATLTGAQTWTNKTFKSPIIQGTVRETVYTITDGGSVDINPANGSIQLWQLFDDRSPTAASFANGQAIVLMLNNPAGFTITWPTVTWFNGVSPIHQSSKYSIIVLSKRGGTLYGKFIGSAGSVSPLALFDAGEQGAFFLPHPKTCFTDTARTTPAAVGDTVAGMTDLSGRGNHATQSTSASRPILRSGTGGYYLEFDGTDDFMVTGSIDFTGTDKMTILAGIRKTGAAAFGALVELGNGSGAAGTFGLFAPGPSPFDNYQISLTGSASASFNYTPFTAPITNVLTVSLDIGGATRTDEIQFRANGAAVTGSGGTAGPAGTGNFSNNPLYIGRRAGTSIPFKERIYGLIVRGAASDSTAIARTEAFLNALSGAY